MNLVNTTSMKAVVIGGTGQVGRNAVSFTISSSQYSAVTEFGRRFFDISSPKRTTQVCSFDQLEPLQIRAAEADVLIIAMGTNRKNAGSGEAFKKIDQDYVVDFAQAARTSNAQRLVYCSSWGADANSSGLYLRSKGETEQRLAKLGYETIICRPAYLTGSQRARKPYEYIAPSMMAVAKIFGVSSTIDVAQVGIAMAKAGVLGREGLQKLGLGEERNGAWYLYNAQRLDLAEKDV